MESINLLHSTVLGVCGYDQNKYIGDTEVKQRGHKSATTTVSMLTKSTFELSSYHRIINLIFNKMKNTSKIT